MNDDSPLDSRWQTWGVLATIGLAMLGGTLWLGSMNGTLQTLDPREIKKAQGAALEAVTEAQTKALAAVELAGARAAAAQVPSAEFLQQTRDRLVKDATDSLAPTTQRLNDSSQALARRVATLEDRSKGLDQAIEGIKQDLARIAASTSRNDPTAGYAARILAIEKRLEEIATLADSARASQIEGTLIGELELTTPSTVQAVLESDQFKNTCINVTLTLRMRNTGRFALKVVLFTSTLRAYADGLPLLPDAALLQVDGVASSFYPKPSTKESFDRENVEMTLIRPYKSVEVQIGPDGKHGRRCFGRNDSLLETYRPTSYRGSGILGIVDIFNTPLVQPFSFSGSILTEVKGPPKGLGSN